MAENSKGNTAVGRFVVVGIRHFGNGEHHWLAPSMDTAERFMAHGIIWTNHYGKPIFGNIDDAMNLVDDISHAETTLTEWEVSRPTYVVVDESTYNRVVERESNGYPWPNGSDEWSDEDAADFERECDCHDFMAGRVS